MERMSTLPTIKCSSCAVDIDILHLADHVCAAASTPSEYGAAVHYFPKLISVSNGGPRANVTHFDRHDRLSVLYSLAQG